MKTAFSQHAAPLLRFSLIGILNTAIYYACYLLLIPLMPYLVSHLIAWALAITASFFLNCRYTYRVPATFRRYLAFPLSNLPNVLATSAGVVLLIEVFHTNERLAPLIAGICAVPFSYLFGRFLMLRPSLGPAEPHSARSTHHNP